MKGENAMPTIFLHMIEGISKEQKKNMVKQVSEAAAKDVGLAVEKVRVILTERSPENMSIGGKLLDDNKSLYPIAFVNTKAGKSDELLKGLRQHISEAISETCGIPIEQISIYFVEHRV